MVGEEEDRGQPNLSPAVKEEAPAEQHALQPSREDYQPDSQYEQQAQANSQYQQDQQAQDDDFEPVTQDILERPVEEEDNYDEDYIPVGPVPLVDELGIDSLDIPISAGRGRIFSVAGRDTPVGEFTSDHLILHPPQKPFEEQRQHEDIVLRQNERGVLLNELGQPKHISGARFQGEIIWILAETEPESTRHYGAWFDEEGNAHKLYLDGEPLTADVLFRLRNKTHDGELTIFADLVTD